MLKIMSTIQDRGWHMTRTLLAWRAVGTFLARRDNSCRHCLTTYPILSSLFINSLLRLISFVIKHIYSTLQLRPSQITVFRLSRSELVESQLAPVLSSHIHHGSLQRSLSMGGTVRFWWCFLDGGYWGIDMARHQRIQKFSIRREKIGCDNSNQSTSTSHWGQLWCLGWNVLYI